MRLIHILHHYMKGIRLLGFVLSLLMLWAIICGIAAYGKVQSIENDLNIVASADLENAYLLSYFFNMGLQTGQSYTKTVVDALEADPAVDKVLSVSVANPVSYKGHGISIVLYEPELLDFFPELKKSGIDFKDCPDGCILGSKIFNSLDTDDMINLSFSGNEYHFPVAGHVQNPYRRFSLSVSSSSPLAGDLFTEGDTIIMQATPTVLTQLETLAKRIELDSNLIVVFKNDTTSEKQEAVLSSIASGYRCFHFKQIIANTERKVSETLKREMPQPAFLAIMSFVSFLSILFLIIKKKSKTVAVLYLCGYGQRKCSVLSFMASQVFLFFPILLSMLFVMTWSHINWRFMRGTLFALRSFLESVIINTSCMNVVLWYYLIMTISAVAVTVFGMLKHTPVTYLRRKL